MLQGGLGQDQGGRSLLQHRIRSGGVTALDVSQGNDRAVLLPSASSTKVAAAVEDETSGHTARERALATRSRPNNAGRDEEGVRTIRADRASPRETPSCACRTWHHHLHYEAAWPTKVSGPATSGLPSGCGCCSTGAQSYLGPSLVQEAVGVGSGAR